MFDKNIALALYNRGQYEESVNYFEKSLDYYWGKLPRHPVQEFFKFASGFIHFLIALFFPFLKFRKELTPEVNKAIDLYYKKCKALIMIDPKRFFIESFYFMRKVAIYDYTKTREGISHFVGASALFSFTGLSFRLSSKILDFGEDKIDHSNVRQMITYDLLATTHHTLEGNWDNIKPYDETLVDRNIEKGEVWLASQYIYWNGNHTICRGHIKAAEKMVARLEEIGVVYENDLSRLFHFLLSTYLLIETGRFMEATQKVDESIDFIKKSGPHVALIDMYSVKARLNLEFDNIGETKKYIKLAESIILDANAVPSQIGEYYLVRCEHYLHQLKTLEPGVNGTDRIELHKKGFKAARRFLKNTRYAAYNLPKACSLMGNLYWSAGRQRKALKWWRKAISECESVGARLSLAKCYLNIGCHLVREESMYGELDNIPAAGYLEKAEELYTDLGMQWDNDMINN
jgi:tetratricopeptide (TPR) repeat protein